MDSRCRTKPPLRVKDFGSMTTFQPGPFHPYPSSSAVHARKKSTRGLNNATQSIIFEGDFNKSPTCYLSKIPNYTVPFQINKTLRSEARMIVYNTLKFCNEEKLSGSNIIPLNQVNKRVSKMTGVSERTLKTIKKEGEKSELSGERIKTPGKKKSEYKNKIKFDDLDLAAIRNTVISFYTIKKEIPTLKKTVIVVNNTLSIMISRETLRKALLQIGFHFKKCKNKKLILIEKPEIIAWRAKYLRRVMGNRIEKQSKPVVYLDETLFDGNFTNKKCGQLEDTKNEVLTGHSSVDRFIIIHAGSSEGFIGGAFHIFKCKLKTGDCNSEINFHYFEKWVKEMLLPNLPQNSLVVMDNAPYHSVVLNKAPSVVNNKLEIKAWLDKNDISYDDSCLKAELLTLVKKNKNEIKYKIDSIFEDSGHEVCRLPPYHCDLNPIDKIWNIVKQKIGQKNETQGSSNLEIMIREAVSGVSASEWEAACQNVKVLEKKYHDQDIILDEVVDDFVINMGSDCGSDYEDNDSEDSEMSGVEDLSEDI